MQPWGVTRIPAYSPEARGRSERACRTVQDRLPNERALAGITERAAATRYRTEPCLPQPNERCMVRATEPGPAFIPWVGTPRAEILCVHAERGVAQENTVRSQGLSLQIPQDPHRFHEVTVTVRGHAYPDGTVAWVHGPRCLARDRAEGPRLGQPRPPLSSGGRCLTRPATRSSSVDQLCARCVRTR